MKINYLFFVLFLFSLTQSKSSNYDCFILALQWGNGICETSTCREGVLDSIDSNIFTIHGLWPSLSSGKIMEECNSENDVYVKINKQKQLFQKMYKYWPSFTSKEGTFWGHEYNKHGYCYDDSDYEHFFETVINFYEQDELVYLMSDLYPDHEDGDIKTNYKEFKENMENVYPGAKFQIKCKKSGNDYYLTEIYFYYDTQFYHLQDVNLKNSCKYDFIIKFR
jgi:ribonuclease I